METFQRFISRPRVFKQHSHTIERFLKVSFLEDCIVVKS